MSNNPPIVFIDGEAKFSKEISAKDDVVFAVYLHINDWGINGDVAIEVRVFVN